MLIRDAIDGRLETNSAQGRDEVQVGLPLRLKTERMTVRNGMLKRLASSRAFALGDRSGVLRAAQNRSGRAFRLDVRQRVIVKALVSRHVGKGVDRGAALAKHVVYLGRLAPAPRARDRSSLTARGMGSGRRRRRQGGVGTGIISGSSSRPSMAIGSNSDPMCGR